MIAPGFCPGAIKQQMLSLRVPVPRENSVMASAG